MNCATTIDLKPVAFAPSAKRPFIPKTDLIEQLKIYGDADVTVSLSIFTVGDNPERFGVEVVDGVVGSVYVKDVSLKT